MQYLLASPLEAQTNHAGSLPCELGKGQAEDVGLLFLPKTRQVVSGADTCPWLGHFLSGFGWKMSKSASRRSAYFWAGFCPVRLKLRWFFNWFYRFAPVRQKLGCFGRISVLFLCLNSWSVSDFHL